MSGILNSLWSDRRVRVAVAVLPALAAALVAAWLTPRGPVSTSQAVASMVGALAVGLTVGYVMRSRWSVLAAPTVFVVVLEMARVGVDGPTVDGIHLGSTYGVIAFVLGRLVHGLLVLLPMAVGAAYGTWLAGRMRRGTARALGRAGWAIAGLTTVALIAVAITVARPSSTTPILGADGEPLPGSVAELVSVSIGGHDQTLMIRGRSVDNPVILYLAGGPGGTDLGAMRADTGLEQDFVVVTWEQRGVGKSYASLDPVDTLTVERAVADTIEVTEHLRARFDEEKVFLVGNSWGTVLGVLAVERHPELFHAFVGAGQMVSPRATDVMFYEDTLAWARETGDEVLATTLLRNGPPPYDDIRAYEAALSHEHDWNVYPPIDAHEMPGSLFVAENSLMDRVNGLRSFLDTFSVLYPQLQDIDFRRDIPRLEVPVYLVQGRYEARGRAVPAREWFDLLEAPTKEMIVFEHSGHRPQFEEPAAFATLMAAVAEAHHADRLAQVLP